MYEMKNSGIEWIGEIPSDWDLMRLQFCLKEVNVKNNPVQTTQVLSLMKDVGVLPYEEKGDIGNKSKENVSEYHLAYPNTIVLNCMNILIGSVGISNYFGCVSPVYYVFKETEQSDLRFINYIFNTREFQKELRKYAKGILEIRLRVSADDIFKRKIALPSKEKQIKIATFLDQKCSDINCLYADVEKQIEGLEEYKKAVITETVTKGLNPDVEMKDSGNIFLGHISSKMNLLRFKYVAKIKSNLVSPEKYQDFYQIAPDSIEKNSGKIVMHRTVEEAAVDSWNQLFRKGQLLYSKIRPVLNKAVIAPYDGLCSADMYPIETPLNTKYLLYTMLSSYFVSQVDVITRDRIKMPKINQDELNNILVCVPNKAEQKIIASYLDRKCAEIDVAIADKKAQLETLAEYKKSLIYEYVTGKKEVPDNYE